MDTPTIIKLEKVIKIQPSENVKKIKTDVLNEEKI